VTWGVRSGYERGLADEVSVKGSSSSSGPGFYSMEETEVFYKSNAKVPLVLDVGGRLGPYFVLGGYLKAEVVLGKSSNSVGGGIGGFLGFDLAPRASVNPRIGVGLGHQWLTFDDHNFTGLEIVPELLIPFKVGKQMTIGPFAALTLVDYSTDLCDYCSGWNSWLALGLRVGG
jgi:hypothetical protein